MSSRAALRSTKLLDGAWTGQFSFIPYAPDLLCYINPFQAFLPVYVCFSVCVHPGQRFSGPIYKARCLAIAEPRHNIRLAITGRSALLPQKSRFVFGDKPTLSVQHITAWPSEHLSCLGAGSPAFHAVRRSCFCVPALHGLEPGPENQELQRTSPSDERV
jgi:hypothetical protein